VSRELIRVAIAWEELWQESLEEASRLYFGDGNVQGMLDTLMPLHLLVQAGPATMSESVFLQHYGGFLSAAWGFTKEYRNIIAQSGRTIPTCGAAPKRRGRDSNQQQMQTTT
jgi:FKBP12-rapamycin complex-associated protein